MRKILVLMLALMLACLPAHAATEFTLPFANATPVTNHMALSGVSAVARGRTIVIRISDEWMEAQAMITPFGWSSATCANEEEETVKLTTYFTESERQNFLNTANAFGYNKVNVCSPSISDVDNELTMMNRRHMDGCWYVIIRPDAKFTNTYSFEMNICNVAVTFEHDQLSTNVEGETQAATYGLNIQSANDSKSVFDKSGGNLRMVVFNELGANIAVIYEKGGDAGSALLKIKGVDSLIELDGYKDGSKAVYCCTLSDTELFALQSGATIEIL